MIIPRRLAPLALVVILTGCGDKPLVPTGSALSLTKEPDAISVPLQDARNLYATVRTIATDRISYVQAKCARRELSVAECAQITEDVGTLKKLDFEVSRSLNSPKATLDVAKVTKILEVSAKIIGALIK